ANETRDALVQLVQSRMRQLLRQLRLAGKNDLQQFSSWSFKIRKQANRFENRRVKVLGFIDHNDEAISGARLLQQAAVEFFVHLHEILAVAVDADFRQQEAHELARTALRLKQKCGARTIAELFQQMEQQRGLAHARLGNERKKSAVGFNSVKERSQRLPVPRSQV